MLSNLLEQKNSTRRKFIELAATLDSRQIFHKRFVIVEINVCTVDIQDCDPFSSSSYFFCDTKSRQLKFYFLFVSFSTVVTALHHDGTSNLLNFLMQFFFFHLKFIIVIHSFIRNEHKRVLVWSADVCVV